jgi:hypothetical protein
VTTCPGGAVRWSNNGGTLPSVCSGEESVNFVASDDCGAQAEVTFNFKIVDVTAPVMTKKAQPGLFVCSLGKYDEANAVYQQWLASHGSATAVDTCSAELTWEHNAPANLPQQCDFSLNVAFDAFDSCGFSANTYNLFTVVGCCVVTTTTLPTTTTKPTTTTADPELAAKQGSSSGIPIYAPIVGALAGVVLVAVIAALVVRHLRNKNSSRGDEEKNSVLDDARSNASSTLSD